MSESRHYEDSSSVTALENMGVDRQELWSEMSEAQTMSDFGSNWLRLLAAMGGAEKQLLLVGLAQDNVYKPLAFWPGTGTPPEALAEVIEQVIDENCGLVLDMDGVAGNFFAVAYPVHVDNQIQFVVAAEVEADDEVVLAECMERLQWGSAWLEAMSRRLASLENQQKMQRITLATDLLAQVLDEDGYNRAAMTLVTELAHQMDCDRVSIGQKTGDRVKIQAISHSAQFSEKMNLIRAISAAMDEAVLQNHDLVYPPQENADEILICRDHEHLAKVFGVTSILTIPLFNGSYYYGAITLERTGDAHFTAGEIGACRELAALAGAALQEKWKNDRSLVIKARDEAGIQLKRLFGPKYVGRKIVAIAFIVLIACCALIEGDYRLSADTVLEGEVQRMVVAPYNGYIYEAKARAGDIVSENDILCQLDDRDLRLERLNWLSQQSQLQKQRQEALAKHERAQVNILSAQLEQADAQLALIAAKLERTLLRAPYQGLITSGDLTQRLGGAVQQGEVLYEVAPLDKYRIILKVDERRISDVQVGQPGELVLTSMPEERFSFETSKITPITIAEEGVNYFRVEAQLAQNHDSLRPGMEGVGKILIEQRNLFGVWTRDLREWFTLWLWSWWP